MPDGVPDRVELPLNTVLLGDCLDRLKELPPNSIDALVTDPPYGLGTKEPTRSAIAAYLAGEPLDTGGDFMNRDWSIPPIAVWEECFRVLKPGAHVLVFGGTRTFDLISLGLRAAGFECRDTVASQFGVQVLEYVHGQGFPKSINILKYLEKAIQNRYGGTCTCQVDCMHELSSSGGGIDDASVRFGTGKHQPRRLVLDNLCGWGIETECVCSWCGKPDPEWLSTFSGLGSSLKPSWEPILVFRKPITESTIAKQVLVTRTGALNIDACRVQMIDRATYEEKRHSFAGTAGAVSNSWKNSSPLLTPEQLMANSVAGRWPANMLWSHLDSCKVVGSTKVPAPVINRFTDGMKPFGGGAGHAYESEQRGDAEGNETVPVYCCEEGCPVKVLDEQSGISKPNPYGCLRTQKAKAHDQTYNSGNWRGGQTGSVAVDAAPGGASRFYSQFQPDAPFLYAPKVSKAERDRGLAKGTNRHPTMKSQALMRWLVRLVTRKQGVVLDPFCGSGSTCIAALAEGCQYIGIERDPEFHELAVKRISASREMAPDVWDELARLPEE